MTTFTLLLKFSLVSVYIIDFWFVVTMMFILYIHGEGNGNPLQCSCLENPRDGGAWWAAVSGVSQSRTRLKQHSSSSSSVLFFSVLAFYSFVWFVFISFNSFINFLQCSFILLPSFLNIFMITDLESLLGIDCLSLFHLVLLLGFYFILNLDHILFLPHFTSVFFFSFFLFYVLGRLLHFPMWERLPFVGDALWAPEVQSTLITQPIWSRRCPCAGCVDPCVVVGLTTVGMW